MSTNAPGLTQLKAYADSKLGTRFFLGIVGDKAHTFGYHLGPDRIPNKGGDYSTQLARDLAGARKFPNYACGYDIGMGWSDSRRWLAWLIDQCRKGTFPQIREVIGSLDGVHKQYWSGLRGFRTERYTGDNHVDHSHISVYRDTAEQDHSGILRLFFEGHTAVAAKAQARTAQPPVQTSAAPAFPGRLLRFTQGKPMMQGQDVRTWQTRMRQRGWNLTVDGVYGPGSMKAASAFQREKRLPVDGIVGPQTWAATWTAPVT
jgi:hypothetical protein